MLDGLTRENKFTFDVQVRGFKTDRSVKAEMLRNPSVLQRIKTGLGIFPGEGLEPRGPVDNVSSERLKQMLSNDEAGITELEKQRIKIAFAEGYLVGSHPGAGKVGKAAKYLKIMQQVLIVVVFFVIVVNLMANASGSVFR